MIEELRIRGLGVIADALLPLGPGLTVVTGETGAGKTMVVSSLLLLFGGRADAARVRGGADTATVDGRITRPLPPAVVQRVTDAGGTLDEDGTLLVRRTVTAAGRSRAHVGGAPTPVAVLADLADSLIAVHGQFDQQLLARPARQREALDRFAGIDLTDFAAAFRRWRAACDQLSERTARAAELRREADLLQFGIREIEAADPQPGEDTELRTKIARLAGADALVTAARTAHDALLGNPDDPAGDAADVAALLGAARRALAGQAPNDPELAVLAGRLDELAALAAELGADLAAYADGIDTDPSSLQELEGRRAVLTTLIRKYAEGPEPDADAVLRWVKEATARLADIDVSDEALADLRRAREEAATDVTRRGRQLTAARRQAAGELGRRVTTELRGLAMPRARVEVAVRPRAGDPALGELAGATRDGFDEVEILLQPHPDAPALPLGRGVSGGELSRVMLALEVALTDSDPVPTMIFDEVDAGVGGRAALEVGRRLARLAANHQVLVVTHLAQVAAFADSHIVVDKPARAVTASDIRVVDGPARLAELARMLGGIDSDTAREHAAELLAAAARPR